MGSSIMNFFKGDLIAKPLFLAPDEVTKIFRPLLLRARLTQRQTDASIL